MNTVYDSTVVLIKMCFFTYWSLSQDLTLEIEIYFIRSIGIKGLLKSIQG